MLENTWESGPSKQSERNEWIKHLLLILPAKLGYKMFFAEQDFLFFFNWT